MRKAAIHPDEVLIPDDISEIAPKTVHTYGAVHINYLMYIFIPLLLLAPCYTYYMAVKTGEQKPYPHSTITNTACYFPQDIAFRGINLPAGSFISLIYFAIYKWIAAEKRRIGYPGPTFEWMHPLAQASVLGFLAAISTIDGAGYPGLHSIGAVFFFVLLFLIAIVVTMVARDMQEWDSTVLNRSSFLSKTIVAAYLLGVIIYCLVGALLKKDDENDDDIHLVIAQWNLVFAGLVWLFTFSNDWHEHFVVLRGNFSSTIKQLP